MKPAAISICCRIIAKCSEERNPPTSFGQRTRGQRPCSTCGEEKRLIVSLCGVLDSTYTVLVMLAGDLKMARLPIDLPFFSAGKNIPRSLQPVIDYCLYLSLRNREATMGAVQPRLTGRKRKEKKGISSEMELIPTQFEPATQQRQHGCQMAKFDPFLSLDCARVEGVGAQSKEGKGSNFAA